MGFSMVKGHKSDFLTGLLAEIQIDIPERLPKSLLPTSYLIDAMSFIQRYQHLGARTFGDLVECYMMQLLRNVPHECMWVHLFGDQYGFPSQKRLKEDERVIRSSISGPQFEPAENIRLPDWKAFISNSHNKENLLNFISQAICDKNESVIPPGINIVLGGTFKQSERAVQVSRTMKSNIHDLYSSDHEEADTRLIAHLAYCANNISHTRVVISATDTDIIILSLYHLAWNITSLTEIWVERNGKYLPVHDLLYKLSEKFAIARTVIASSILIVYVLSGCDSVSYIYRQGKRKAAKVALKLAGNLNNLEQYGLLETSLDVGRDLIDEARKVFVTLYGYPHIENLNQLRQHAFAGSKSDLRVLPPTEDAFYQHILRCLYQIILYKRAHLSNLRMPAITNFGRKVVNGKLQPIMMTKAAKPTFAKINSCKCKATRCLRVCACAKASVPCSIRCNCLGSSDRCGRVLLQTSSDDDDDEADDYL